uniref:Uncharacterized protein n=1 Tax=Anguilla anguilla TaxID=7936 RepID=A0A0E9U1B6_ANGAN
MYCTLEKKRTKSLDVSLIWRKQRPLHF